MQFYYHKFELYMKYFLLKLLFVCSFATLYAQNATINLSNITINGKEVTFKIVLTPASTSPIYLGNFDIGVAFSSSNIVSSTTPPALLETATLLNSLGSNITVSGSMATSGKVINFDPSNLGTLANQADFDRLIPKVTSSVSLGTYKITFNSAFTGTLSCETNIIYSLSNTDTWLQNNLPTISCSNSNTVVPSISGINAAYCKSEVSIALSDKGSPTGGTFTIDGSTATILDPSALSAGTHTLIYTVNGTSSSPTTIEIKAVPIPTITGLNTRYCKDAAAATLLGSPSDGTFTIDGATATTFNPATLSTGNHTVVYTVTQNGCSGSSSMVVNVVPLPTASINNLNSSYCKNSTAITLTGTPAGGTFTIDGATASAFNPASLSTGNHIVIYTVSQNGCTASTSQIATITLPPTATITSLNSSYCKNAAAVTLTGSPSGGTFTVNGVSATTFNPAALAVGNHTVIYSISQNGCTGSISQVVNITSAPSATITNLDPSYCKNAAATTLTGSPTGGTFTIDGVNATTFNPAALTVGNHTVIYTISQNGCTGSISQVVNVTSSPTASITSLNTSYCKNAEAFTLVGAPSGGTFTVNGVSATTFNPAALTVGNHTVIYTISQNGCTGSISQVVNVTSSPTASITSLNTSYCKNAAAFTLVGAPLGGTFTIDGVNATTFNPAALTVGNHTIIYTISQNGCTGSISQVVNITSSPSATITNLDPSYCKNAAALTLTGSPTGGTFTIDGVNATTLNPAALSIGNHTIMYNVSQSGCSASTSQSVSIIAAPTVSITSLNTSYCKNAAAFTLVGAPSGGTFSIDGTNATAFNPTLLSVGNHTVSYTVSQNGCSSVISQVVNILPPPTINFQSTTQGLKVTFYAINTEGVTFLWNFGNNSTSTQKDPVFTYANDGTYKVCLSVTNSQGCTDSICKTITIKAVSVKDLMGGLKVTTAPNPASHFLSVRIETAQSFQDQDKLILNDILGRQVLQKRIVDTQNDIDISDLPNGVYTLRLQLKNAAYFVEKIIISR
jgi:hypothetical protein